MPSEEKQKINVWIPGSLWKKVGSLGYESPTKATIAAFEALVLKEDNGSNQEALGSYQEEIGNYQEKIIPSLKKQIEEAENKVKNLEDRLRTSPDTSEFAQLQARYEEKDKQLEEKTLHIETLKDELAKAERDKEDLKVTYANYFTQVQTLINQKAIEATGAKKQWWRFW